MSNSLAIAAVTVTLQQLLQTAISADPDLGDTTVTTQPLDKARDSNNTANQLNLFLYQTLPSAAWRNMDLPRQVMPGETGLPPLALQLNYVITAYGRNNDAAFGHQVLGKAMSVLNDAPVLGSDEIKTATAGPLPRSDLDRQVERVRLTFKPLPLDDISKLWTAFQTQYQLCAVYEASAVLIESTRPSRAPLPVLTRGPQDRGVGSQTDLVPPFPTLDEVLPPSGQPGARLGETLVLNGHHLDGSDVRVVFNHPAWAAPVELLPLTASATRLTVKLPDPAATWPAGFYTVAVQVRRSPETYRRTTGELPFPLAPTMTITPLSAPAGDITFGVTCSPPVGVEPAGGDPLDPRFRFAQRVALLLGDREIVAAPPATSTTPTGTLTFVALGVPAGDHFARLRIDGVDSLLVDRSVTPPAFDQTQKVTVS